MKSPKSAAIVILTVISSLASSTVALSTHDSATVSIAASKPIKIKKSLAKKHAIIDSQFHREKELQLTARGGEVSASGSDRLRIGSYFALWYALNVYYNIVNKKLINKIPAPVTVGTIQLLVGSTYVVLMWLFRLRPTPKLTSQGKNLLSRVGMYHMAGHQFAQLSFSAGTVSFTHIVKALEPFFSAMVSIAVFKKVMAWQVYTTLLPVVGGVMYACLKDRGFSWMAFNTAMGSNLSFALRAVMSKEAMQGGSNVGEGLSAANIYGVVTIFALLLSIPLMSVMEGGSILKLWKTAVQATTEDGSLITTPMSLVKAFIISGLFHYLNNEVMYLALSNVHPVTLAVGNTMKRVFIIVASFLVFKNPISIQAAIGSAVGISGVLLYSLTKQHYEKLEAAQA